MGIAVLESSYFRKLVGTLGSMRWVSTEQDVCCMVLIANALFHQLGESASLITLPKYWY